MFPEPWEGRCGRDALARSGESSRLAVGAVHLKVLSWPVLLHFHLENKNFLRAPRGFSFSLDPRPRARGTHFAKSTFFCLRQIFVLHTNLFEMAVSQCKNVVFQMSFRRRFFRTPLFVGGPAASRNRRPATLSRNWKRTGQSFSSFCFKFGVARGVPNINLVRTLTGQWGP